jgi:hypothetical protein
MKTLSRKKKAILRMGIYWLKILSIIVSLMSWLNFMPVGELYASGKGYVG